MSNTTKYYVAQYGCAIYGIGETEEQARADARDNGLQFEDSEVNHISGFTLCGLQFSDSDVNHISGLSLCGDRKNYKLVTAEGNELTYGMIICMSEEQKNLYWKW